MTYEWDEAKWRTNLERHGLDFNDAHRVYEATPKTTWDSSYPYEPRLIDMAEVEGRIWALVYTMRGENIRCISLRYAKRKERRIYYEQISNR